MSQLEEKVALVTGGSRGMGAAIATRLAKDGARVVITYARSADKAQAVVDNIEQAGGRAHAVHADSRDPEAVRGAVDEAVSAYDRLDILVNNAGIFDARPFDEFTMEDFDRTVDIHVRAVFVAAQRAAAHMADGSRIITIGSNLAQRVPWPGISLYALSKAAVVGLTKGLARDLGPRGIRVSIVHPGSTDTDMNPADGELADIQRSAMAIPHYGDADDVASLVAWLAGPNARSVTGAEFTVDGGANA